MCRFLSLDFEHTLKCPVDKVNHTVRFQAYPQLRGHVLDVVACSASPRVESLKCGKACRALYETGAYWRSVYPESAVYAQSQ
jgi:hypothetical protein